MNFASDTIAEIEGLPEVNRDFCKKEVGNPKGFQVCHRQTDELKSKILIHRPDGAKGALRFAAELISVSLIQMLDKAMVMRYNKASQINAR